MFEINYISPKMCVLITEKKRYVIQVKLEMICC